jgi:hypothetical protein
MLIDGSASPALSLSYWAEEMESDANHRNLALKEIEAREHKRHLFSVRREDL